MTVPAEYDDEWATKYAAGAAELQEVFGDAVTEHIGSTAVPGLLAKPVIDIGARARSLEAVAGTDSELAAIGFNHELAGPPGRRMYTRHTDGILTQNLHVFPAQPAHPPRLPARNTRRRYAGTPVRRTRAPPRG